MSNLIEIVKDYQRGISIRDLAGWYGPPVETVRLSLTPNVKRIDPKPKKRIKKIPCPNCFIKPLARGLCRACYQAVWKRDELDKYRTTRWYRGRSDVDGASR
jgi:hypothetical protein